MKSGSSLDTAIIIFLRAPEFGKVKTRLAVTVGDEEALKIYKELIKKTLSTAGKTDLAIYLYFFPFIDLTISLDYPQFETCIQKGEDLGDKMYRAFEEVLRQYKKAIIIGTDCPYITPELLIEASVILEKKDVVIGPAEDGGYYLLGLKKNEIEYFKNIEWGTDIVYEKTIAILKKLDKSFSNLIKLSDIDYEDDWQKYLHWI